MRTIVTTDRDYVINNDIETILTKEKVIKNFGGIVYTKNYVIDLSKNTYKLISKLGIYKEDVDKYTYDSY